MSKRTEQTPEETGPNPPRWRMRAVDVIFGLILSLGGLALLVALLSYHPLDPSWNVASEGEVRNLLGRQGASLADIALQTAGWAAAIPAIFWMIWGAIMVWRMPRYKPATIAVTRWLFGFIAMLGFAMTASALPIPATWPFPTALGGTVGDALLSLVQSGPDALDLPAAKSLAGLVGVLITVFGLVLTFGLRTRDVGSAVDVAGLAWATLRVWIDAIAGLGPSLGRLFAGRDEADETPQREEPTLRKAMRAAASPATATAKADDDPVTEPEADIASAAAHVKVSAGKKAKKSDRDTREAQGALPFAKSKGFKLPRLDLLAKPALRSDAVDEAGLRQNAELLQGVLSDFGVKGEIVHVRPGPVVTLYEFEPAPGVKSSRVINLADDIARSMSTTAARVAVVPGRNAIGIELPNAQRETVFLRALLNAKSFEDTKAELPLALGETIGGEPFVADLARMPHLLIAGTTGSGKSVGINAMILSLLYRLPPAECRMIMIDPKMLELSVYDGIPHLLTPVVTDPKKAVVALKWAVREMESRYLRMSKIGVRNISGFNERVADALAAGETLSRTVQTGYDKETGEPVFETETIEAEKMPYIVVIIDEMADLMLVAGKEIEAAVQRLAQMARAAGIHLVTATQRPSVDVITGTIKANFPTRISYSVTSKIDSRTILGEQGAEQLLGMGDLLYMASGGRLRRLHGPFVSDREVEDVASFLKKQGAPEYLEAVTAGGEEDDQDGIPGMEGEGSGDTLFDQAVALVARDRKASTSYIQRRLSIGYNRAATLIERLEEEGMIGPADHAGRREIYLPEPTDE
ncbi:MAG: cell division protein FtsK [Alphaproteobacteria bacterium]|nr:cell division protein FtsK [Alphaproteobacteria bacterium]